MNEEAFRIGIQVISSSVTNCLLFLLFYRIYRPKYKSKLLYVILFVLTSSFIVIVNRIFISYKLTYFNSIFLFAYSFLLSQLLFNVSLNRAFLCNAVYIIISAFVDTMSVLICSFITGENAVTITREIKYVFMFNSFYCLLMVAVWAVFITIFAKNQLENVKTRQIILVSLYILFAIFIEYNFTIRINSAYDAIIDISILIGLFALAIFIVYFTNRIEKMYKEQYHLDLIKKQNELQLEHFNQISVKYEQSRVVIHDVKKHLEVLNSLNNSHDVRATEYAHMIEKQVDSLFGGFQCSNRILSIIMSQKICISEKANIKVETKVEDLLLENLEDVDITAIFANLWDNAIEACEEVCDNDRYINVIIGRVNDFIVISFENSYNGTVKTNNNVLSSSKDNHEGLGLSIIKKSVEKYHGTMTINYHDDIFKVEILIPI